ncbi:MAG: hypothetical protein ABI277_05770 [Burkholderiaceae bacterium]
MKFEPVESQIAGFIAKYAPAIQHQLRAARFRLRTLFPRGHELVSDNDNALVFGISPTDRIPDAVVSIAGCPKWVTLLFLHGSDLDDPAGLLAGDGKQVRSSSVQVFVLSEPVFMPSASSTGTWKRTRPARCRSINAHSAA